MGKSNNQGGVKNIFVFILAQPVDEATLFGGKMDRVYIRNNHVTFLKNSYKSFKQFKRVLKTTVLVSIFPLCQERAQLNAPISMARGFFSDSLKKMTRLQLPHGVSDDAATDRVDVVLRHVKNSKNIQRNFAFCHTFTELFPTIPLFICFAENFRFA